MDGHVRTRASRMSQRICNFDTAPDFRDVCGYPTPAKRAETSKIASDACIELQLGGDLMMIEIVHWLRLHGILYMLLHRFWSRVIWFGVLFFSLLAPLGAAAAPASLQLDGRNGAVLPGNTALDLSFAGTIEFWIAPAWASSIDHDPTVLANVGETGVRYSIHITSGNSASSGPRICQRGALMQ